MCQAPLKSIQVFSSQLYLQGIILKKYSKIGAKNASLVTVKKGGNNLENKIVGGGLNMIHVYY